MGIIFLLCVCASSGAVDPFLLLGVSHMVSVISNDEICNEVNNSRRSNCKQSE